MRQHPEEIPEPGFHWVLVANWPNSARLDHLPSGFQRRQGDDASHLSQGFGGHNAQVKEGIMGGSPDDRRRRKHSKRSNNPVLSHRRQS